MHWQFERGSESPPEATSPGDLAAFMLEVVRFLKEPKFQNFYNKYHKNAHQQLLGHCFVDPFSRTLVGISGPDPLFKSHAKGE